ncbi:hypothetical protein M9Y10_023851 [Tritrichomonas musculus]|uniref:F5/8 type C domain-containing protein n=1 Tax=Tritrichomonas musculus TaxID=1915356 RepID=A0ABR2KW91_9EUKA
MQNEITLSTDSIKEIPFDRYEKNFTFIVNGKEYKTNRFVADILSPKICHLHFTDETIDTFTITTKNESTNIDFSSFLSLINFHPKTLTKEELDYFQNIFSILGNKTEFFKYSPKYEENTTDNVIDHLLSKIQTINNFKEGQKEPFSTQEIEYLKTELEFISSHFFAIDQKRIEIIDSQIFEEIIKSDKLKIEDEGSLLDVIIDFYMKDTNLSYLFEYIDFLNVSIEKLRHFFDIFDMSDLNSHIWRLIAERILKSEVNKEELNKRLKKERYTTEKVTGIQSLLKERGEFNGIIKYLTDKSGGNIVDKGTIDIQYNGCSSNSYHPKYALDYKNSHYYQPSSKNDGWFYLDFKKMKIKITNYSIKSCPNGPNGFHPKSWDIEVSNDASSWIKIDEQKDCSLLNGNLLTATFKVKPNEYSRYVRFHQTSEPWGGGYLDFNMIEFYGYLQEQ